MTVEKKDGINFAMVTFRDIMGNVISEEGRSRVMRPGFFCLYCYNHGINLSALSGNKLVRSVLEHFSTSRYII